MFNWNGTALTGADKIKEFLAKLPPTKHEIQSSDCHAISGESRRCSSDTSYTDESSGKRDKDTSSGPPSLMVVVSGIVSHGPMDIAAKSVNSLPRTFSQSFLMIPEAPSAIGQAAESKYFVSADTMRFVG